MFNDQNRASFHKTTALLLLISKYLRLSNERAKRAGAEF